MYCRITWFFNLYAVILKKGILIFVYDIVENKKKFISLISKVVASNCLLE
jgi:hypothetical protein